MLEEEYQPRRRLPRELRPPAEPGPAFEFTLRDARLDDLPQVLAIYNHYVANSTVTFDEHPMTLSAIRDKFSLVQKLGLPFLVAESPRSQILGYAYAHPWRTKAAYRFTVENSIYLGPAASGKGLGRALMAELIDGCRRAGIREIVAVIADEGAEASIALHSSFGFTEIGRLGRVGYKFDRWLGTILMQKSLKHR